MGPSAKPMYSVLNLIPLLASGKMTLDSEYATGVAKANFEDPLEPLLKYILLLQDREYFYSPSN